MSAEGNHSAATAKKPPHSIEAEMSVLGGLMIRNVAWYPVSGLIGEDDFYTRNSREIWRAMATMFKAGKAVDVLTLTEHLRDSGSLAEVGGDAAIYTLVSDCPGAANIEVYAARIREHSRRRKLIALGQEIADAAYSGDDADEVTARCSAGVESLLRSATSSSVTFDAMATAAISTFREASLRRQRGDSHAVMTGLPGLDFLSGGFHGPQLIVLAARPKSGKTALLNQFAIHAALKGKPGLIVSREMGANQTAARALAFHAKANVSRIERGEADDLRKAEDALSSIRNIPLWFDFETAFLDAIVAQIALHKHRHGIVWAAVDHIGLVKCRERFTSRNDQIGHVSSTLKEAAKRLNMPIVALSQLSRACDTENRRPRADDLRDSGNVEQDADIVLMIHVPMKDRTQFVRNASIGITANRNGPSCWVPNAYKFVGSSQTFYEQAVEAGDDARYAGGNQSGFNDPLSPPG